MSLIKHKAPRWYRDEGGVVEACYQVPAKSRAVLMRFGHSGMKNITLREARELGLLPSVTSILRVMANPWLENWKKEQVIYSAITLPRMPGELDDAFAHRVVEDSEAQAAKAAEFGSRIHDSIAEMMTDRMYWDASKEPFHVSFPLDRAPYLQGFVEWSMQEIEHVHAVEKVVGGKHCGYAGRLDLDCTLRGVGRTICDFKTQNIKEGQRPAFYDTFPIQLAAYADAVPEAQCIGSIIIDSRAPGPVWPKIWNEVEIDKYVDVFQHCFELWKYQNDYDPQASS